MNNQTPTQDKKEFNAITRPCTFIQVSEVAEAVLKLGRKHHYCFRIITDFRGPISGPTFNSKGDLLYNPFKEEDRKIIPKAAFMMHRQLKKAGCRDLQVIIGHEVRESRESPLVLSPSTPEVITPHLPTVTSIPKPKIDWGTTTLVAGGLLAGMIGIAVVSIGALIGSIVLYDPSYCICLDDEFGTVIELLSWNTEV